MASRSAARSRLLTSWAVNWVRTAIMPQPMSTPTAAGMMAPRVGITEPMVAPRPRCASGISATCGNTNGMAAVRSACSRVPSSRIDAQFISRLLIFSMAASGWRPKDNGGSPPGASGFSGAPISAVHCAPQGTQCTALDVGRLGRAAQHDFQRAGVGGPAEHVVGLIEVIQREGVGDEPGRVDLAGGEQAQQGRRGVRVDQAGGDGDVLDPQI